MWTNSKEVPCSLEGVCCKVETQYCVDENGELISYTTYTSSEQGLLCTTYTPVETCTGAYLFIEQTPCTAVCGNN